MSIYGRSIVLVATLAQTAGQLNTLIVTRNALIESLRAGVFNELQERNIYFGTPDIDGRVDRRYFDTLNAIYQHTDDALFFGLEICDELVGHGNKLIATFREQFRKDKVPAISKPDFSKAKEADLIPDYDNYRDWFTGFRKIAP